MPLEEFATKTELTTLIKKVEALEQELVETNQQTALYIEAAQSLQRSLDKGYIQVSVEQELPKIREIEQQMGKQVRTVQQEMSAMSAKLTQYANLDDRMVETINRLAPQKLEELLEQADTQRDTYYKESRTTRLITLACAVLLSLCGMGILWLFVTKLF